MDLMVTGFQLIGIFCMAGEILEGIKTMLSLHVIQAITKVIASEDSFELTKLRSKLASEAIIVFAARGSLNIHSSPLVRAHFGLGADG